MVGKEKLFWFTKDYMISKNIKRIRGYMFRYIYPLNKSSKKLLKKSTVEWNINYPKDKDLEWFDATDGKNKKKIDKPEFTFESLKYNQKNVNAHKKNKNVSLEAFFS
jgi:hypothetical protein